MKNALFTPTRFLTIGLLFLGAATASSQTPPLPDQPNQQRAPGLYVQVLDGAIHLSNQGGATNFNAGQFGYTPSGTQPPVVVPKNPALKFTPPPTFASTPPPRLPSSATRPGIKPIITEVR